MPTVAFLEGVGADQVGGHLARQHHQRNGIHQRIGQAGDALVALGPEVTSTTPGLPVERA